MYFSRVSYCRPRSLAPQTRYRRLSPRQTSLKCAKSWARFNTDFSSTTLSKPRCSFPAKNRSSFSSIKSVNVPTQFTTSGERIPKRLSSRKLSGCNFQAQASDKSRTPFPQISDSTEEKNEESVLKNQIEKLKTKYKRILHSRERKNQIIERLRSMLLATEVKIEKYKSMVRPDEMNLEHVRCSGPQKRIQRPTGRPQTRQCTRKKKKAFGENTKPENDDGSETDEKTNTIKCLNNLNNALQRKIHSLDNTLHQLKEKKNVARDQRKCSKKRDLGKDTTKKSIVDRFQMEFPRTFSKRKSTNGHKNWHQWNLVLSSSGTKASLLLKGSPRKRKKSKYCGRSQIKPVTNIP